MDNKFIPLTAAQVGQATPHLPTFLIEILERPEFKEKVFIAGGFLLSSLHKCNSTDVDLWCRDGETTDALIAELNQECGPYDVTTDRAKTWRMDGFVRVNAVQVITKYFFSDAEEVLNNFDYTIVMAAIWYDGERWKGICHERFVVDNEENRLVFAQQAFKFDNWLYGAILRSYKFSNRGYRMTGGSLSKLLDEVGQEYERDINLDMDAYEGKFGKGLSLVTAHCGGKS